jgi:hypothetical protein
MNLAVVVVVEGDHPFVGGSMASASQLSKASASSHTSG